MVSVGFENPIGWLAFLSFIPFILAYLIKHKSQDIDIPSLMFFNKDELQKNSRAFFRKVMQNKTFYLQLFALLFLSFFFTQPHITLGKSFLVDNAVIILDVSASSALDDTFKTSIQEAKKVLGKKSTLILVAGSPRLVAEEADKKEIINVLDDLTISYSESPLGEAMEFAADYAKGDQNVFVISDFMDTGETGVEKGKELLEAQGAKVHLIGTGKDKAYNNVGIINVETTEEKATIAIKNFRQESVSFDVSLNSEKRSLTLEPRGVELLNFDPRKGINTVEIHYPDDFLVDNKAFISVPSEKQVRALLVTNNPSSYLKAALTASDTIALDIQDSIPSKPYDVYIIHKANSISAEDLAFLEKHVSNGAGLIIHAQDNMDASLYGKLLPLTLLEKKGYAPVALVGETRFTQGITFGSVEHYYATGEHDGLVLAKADESSIISLHTLGNGRIVYYGIMEDATTFVLDPGYPLFWIKIIQYLGDYHGASELTREGGSRIQFTEPKTVVTPSKTITASTVYFDEGGIYEIDGEQFAVNLASEKESSLMNKDAQHADTGLEITKGEGVQQELKDPLILAALAFVFLELLIMKGAGEL